MPAYLYKVFLDLTPVHVAAVFNIAVVVINGARVNIVTQHTLLQ